jgi:UDP-galactopyranose mutase
MRLASLGPPVHFDLVCLSHLRWDFVYQRPQHLLSRFARRQRVFFIEEPLPATGNSAWLEVSSRAAGLHVVVPHLPEPLTGPEAEIATAALIKRLFARSGVEAFALWYYTPMALGYTLELPRPLATVYDCMDELSAFRGAPPELVAREAELLAQVDLVFTGGQSLYDAKRRHHDSVHLFPSAVDLEHFGQARNRLRDPGEQACLPHPRLGFFGVLDERLDTDLLATVADLRPEWQLVLVGPVAKIDPSVLPRRPNLHYLGQRAYIDLPPYLANWDVALLPFARNEATRFISPTKTPEYLAAGRPVVSTSIADVVRPYGERGLVRIADDAPAFVEAVEAALAEEAGPRGARADAFLANMSWDRTWSAMDNLLRQVIERRRVPLAVGAAD